MRVASLLCSDKVAVMHSVAQNISEVIYGLLDSVPLIE